MIQNNGLLVAWLIGLSSFGFLSVGCSSNNTANDGGEGFLGAEDGQIEDSQLEPAIENESLMESKEYQNDMGLDCSFQILPKAGSQEACGIRIMVPANVVNETKNIFVSKLSLQGNTRDKDLLQNSDVFSIQTDPVDFSFLAYVTIHLPHRASSNKVWAAKYFSEYESFGVFETCLKDTKWAGFRTTSLGIYTVLEDQGNNDASGSGQATVVWNQKMGTFSYEGIGFANYIPSASGTKSVDLYGIQLINDKAEKFRVTFVLNSEGTFEAGTSELMFYDTKDQVHRWVNYPGITPEPPIAIGGSETAENHVVGTMSGKLYEYVDPDWVEHEVSAEFDANIVRHFWGSEDPCFYEP